jgi:hypothetical protein
MHNNRQLTLRRPDNTETVAEPQVVLHKMVVPLVVAVAVAAAAALEEVVVVVKRATAKVLDQHQV